MGGLIVVITLTAKTNRKVTDRCIDYIIFSKFPNKEYVHLDADFYTTYRTAEGIRVEMRGVYNLGDQHITAEELRNMKFLCAVYDDDFTLEDVRIESIEEE